MDPNIQTGAQSKRSRSRKGQSRKVQQTTSQQTVPQQTPPQQTGFQQTPPQQTGLQQTPPQQTGLQQTPPQQTGLQQTALQQTGLQQTPPQQTGLQQTALQQTGFQQTAPQQTGFQQTPPQQTGFQQTPPQQTGFQQTPPQQTGLQQTALQQTGFQQTAPQQTGFQQTPPQQTGFQQTPPQQTGFQQTPPQQTGLQQTALQQTGFQQTAPQQTGFQQKPSQQTGFQQTALQKTGFQQTPPQQTGFQQTAPHQTGFQQTPPQQTGLQQTVPQQTGHSSTVQFSATDHINLKLYKMVGECAQCVLLEVFKAASHTFSSNMSFLTYLEQQKGFSKTVLKHSVNRTQRETILKDFLGDTYDVSLLFTAITLLRSQLQTDQTTGKVKLEPPNDTLQTHITTVKDFRNDLMHTQGTQSRSSTVNVKKEFVAKTETLRNELSKVLEEMKDVYQVDDSEVSKALQRMNNDLNYIRDNRLKPLDKQQYEDQILLTELSQLLMKTGVAELKETYEKWSYISPLSFVDGLDSFIKVGVVFTRLEIIEAGRNSKNTSIDYTDIFDYLQDVPSHPSNSEIEVILIEGPAGCGKTTLTKMLLHNWVTDTSTISGLNYFDLLFHIECRNPNIKTLLQLIKSLMHQTSKKFCDEDLMTCVTEFKLLFLIDGLDELNDSSTNVIRELFNLPLSCSVTIICTSRSERIKNFYKMVPNLVKVTHLKVLGIPDSQRIRFAEKYHNELIKTGESKQSTVGLTEYLKLISSRLQEHLRLPLNLVMITLLWALAPDRVNSVTSASELYNQILELSKEKLIERLTCKHETQNMTFDQLKKKIEMFLLKLYDDSLKSLKEDNIILTSELTDRLHEACDFIGLPQDEITGAFLVKKTIWTDIEMKVYVSFPHKGLQDFYAACYLFSLLRKPQPKIDLTSILKDIQTVMENHEIPSLTSYEVVEKVSCVLQSASSTETLTLSEIIEKKCKQDASMSLSKYQNVFVHLSGLLYSDGAYVDEEMVNTMVLLLVQTRLTDHSQWMDVLVDAKCDNKMALSIAQNIPEIISGNVVIPEGYVAAYASLLPYSDPDSVELVITGPESPPRLINLFDVLMNLDTQISLEFTHQFRHPQTLNEDLDDKLQLLFESCEVLKFVGGLSEKAVRRLGEDIRMLSLAICDNHPYLSDALTSLTQCPYLSHLDIHVPAGTNVDNLPSVPPLPCIVYFSGVNSQHLDWVAEALTRLNLSGRKLNSLKFPRCELSKNDLCDLLGRVRSVNVDVLGIDEKGGIYIPGDQEHDYISPSGYVIIEQPEMRDWI